MKTAQQSKVPYNRERADSAIKVAMKALDDCNRIALELLAAYDHKRKNWHGC